MRIQTIAFTRSEDYEEADGMMAYMLDYLREHPEGFLCSQCGQETGPNPVYDGEFSIVCRACSGAIEIVRQQSRGESA